MATVSRTLACIGSAMIDSQNPSNNYHGATSYDMVPNPRRALCLKFEAFPQNLRRNKLYSAAARDYYRAVITSSTIYGSIVSVSTCGDFDETTATWNSVVYNSTVSPKSIGSTNVRWTKTGGYSPTSPCAFPDSPSSGNDATASKILQPSCIMIEGVREHTSTDQLFLNTRTASQKPTLTVQYDDTAKVLYQPKGQKHTSGFVDRFIDNDFSWKISKAETAYCVADPIQQSAEFQWRVDGASAWNSVPVSGETNEVTIPGGTFDGTTLEWRIVVVDDLGDTLTSPTYTNDMSVGELTATPSSPTNGAFVDPLTQSLFMWTNQNAHGITQQTGADLQRSSDGTTWSTLGSVSGESQSFRAPANTFGTGTYYWRVRAYNADGEAGPWSDAAQFSTVDSPMYAAAEQPVGEICENNKPIVFTWTYSSDTGTRPTRSDVQWSSDGTTWTDLATVPSSIMIYTAPANTFPAGTIYWRVRNYNHNNEAGPWSAVVTFISYGAPATPSVSVDAVPYATISWQSSGQEAWRVTVDGKTYGPTFGTAKSLTLDDPLEDGQHTASVAIQGAFGLWSEAGQIVFSVENQPGADIHLSGVFYGDAALSWNSFDVLPETYVYRDGQKIAKPAGSTYTDRLAVGLHSWHVLAKLPGGYYTKSNTVRGELHVCKPKIAKFPDGEWVELVLSENATRTQTTAYSRSVSLRHIVGAVYPVLEVSAFCDESTSFDTAFADDDAARAFEALRGEIVILKTCDGIIVGCLAQIQRVHRQFYTGYTFTLQRIHWEDYIDET